MIDLRAIFPKMADNLMQIAKDEWLLISIVAAIVVVVVLGLIANVILAPADASSSSSSKKCASYSYSSPLRRAGELTALCFVDAPPRCLSARVALRRAHHPHVLIINTLRPLSVLIPGR